MADPKSFDDIVVSIPEDASPATKLHLRAQMTLQAAFYAFGEEAGRPGSYTLGRTELTDVLAAAVAMLLATDRGIQTPSDIQGASEQLAERVASFTQALQGDHSVEQLLSMLGMSSSQAN